MKDKKRSTIITAGDGPQVYDDLTIYNMAVAAGGGFLELYNGDTSVYNNDDSRGDLALFNLLQHHTKNADQIRRIWSQSALGQRKKMHFSKRERTLKKAFDLTPPEIQFDAIFEEIKQFEIRNGIEPDQPTMVTSNISLQEPVAEVDEGEYQQDQFNTGEMEHASFQMPPGLMGELTKYTYEGAVKPVPEVALFSAITFMAAFAARYYHINGLGLNQYAIMLVASGGGKEAAWQAQGELKEHLEKAHQMIQVKDYFGSGQYSSGQAIFSDFESSPTKCFMSRMTEFAQKLPRLTQSEFGPDVSFKSLITDLWSTCRPGGVLDASTYADRSKNTTSVDLPALTIAGDGQPKLFYPGLRSGIIDSGLMPRFLFLHYNGLEPFSRFGRKFTITPTLDSQLSSFVAGCMSRHNAIATGEGMQEITFDSETTLHYVQDVDREWTTKRRKLQRQNDPLIVLWSRIVQKALKLAGLVAVGVNPHRPICTQAHVDWALEVCTNDTTTLCNKINQVGVIGGVQSAQQRIILDLFRDFLKTDIQTLNSSSQSAKITEVMKVNGVIPLSYLTLKCRYKSAFKDQRKSPTQLVKSTLQELEEFGELVHVPRHEATKKFKFHGSLYAIQPGSSILSS